MLELGDLISQYVKILHSFCHDHCHILQRSGIISHLGVHNKEVQIRGTALLGKKEFRSLKSIAGILVNGRGSICKSGLCGLIY